MTTTGLEIVEEWAAGNADPRLNMDKVWAAAYTASGHYLACWGRRGTRYQSMTRAFPTVAGAAALFRSKRAEKLGKGYVEVPFGHSRYGAIPSFATGVAGGPAAAGAARITLDGVLAELAAVPGRLRRAGPRLPDVVFAFTQTRAKAELLLLGGRLAEPERRACLDTLAAARDAVGRALAA